MNFIKLSHGTKLHFSSQGKSTDNFFFPPELQKGFFPCIFLEFVTKESGTKYILYVGKKAGYQKGHKIVCKMEVTKGLTARHALVGRKKGGTKATFKKERKAKVRLSKGRPSLRLTSGFGNQIQTLLNDSLPGADNTTEKPNPSHYRLSNITHNCICPSTPCDSVNRVSQRCFCGTNCRRNLSALLAIEGREPKL